MSFRHWSTTLLAITIPLFLALFLFVGLPWSRPLAAQQPVPYDLATGNPPPTAQARRLPASDAYLLPAGSPLPPGMQRLPLTYRALSGLRGPWPAMVEPARSRASTIPTLTLTLDPAHRLLGGITDRPNLIAITLTHALVMLAPFTTQVTPIPTGEGYFYYTALPYSQMIFYSDTLMASQAGRLLGMTVLTLTALADPDTNLVYGTAPARERLDVRYLPGSLSYHQTTTATISGTYAVDFTPLVSLARGEAGYVARTDRDGGRQIRHFALPQFRLTANGCTIGGRASPESSVRMTITYASREGYASVWVSSDAEGWFQTDNYAWPERETCFTPWLTAGDRITAAAAGQQMTLTFPSLTARPDAMAGRLNGVAPPFAPLTVTLVHDGQTFRHAVTATVTGTYRVDFSGETAWNAGEGGTVLYITADGHRITRRYVAPFLDVAAGTFDVQGFASQYNVPLTLTVRSIAGVLKDTLFLHSNSYDGGFALNGYRHEVPSLNLETGDQIVLDDGVLTTSLTMPLLAAHASVLDDVVRGQAPAGHPVRVTIGLPEYAPLNPLRLVNAQGGYLPSYPPYPPAGSPSLVVTPTAEGTFVADFSTLGNIRPGDHGLLVYTNTTGQRARYHFTAPIVRVQVGGQMIRGILESPNRAGVVTLLDSGGRTKATAPIYLATYGYVIQLPTTIEPGDTVVVRQGEDTTRVPVPPFTAYADRKTSTITGDAPPGTIIHITWWKATYDHSTPPLLSSEREEKPTGGGYPPAPASSGFFTQTVTASAGGTYSASFAGQTTFDAGDYGTVNYTDSNGNQLYRDMYVPLLEVALGQYPVKGYGSAPNERLTITLQTSTGRFTTTATTYRYGYFSTQMSGRVRIQSGDRLTLHTSADVISMTVPLLTARPDRTTGIVSGVAPPSATLTLYPYPSPPSYSWYTHLITVTAGGTYTVDVNPLWGWGDLYGSSRRYLRYRDVQGNLTWLKFTFPSLDVTLGTNWINGFFSTAGQRITATVTGVTGTLKAIATATSSDYAGSFNMGLLDPDGQHPVTLESGDRLTITGGTQVLTLTAPALSATPTVTDSLVRGVGPPHTWLRVTLGKATRSVYTGDDGHYALDFHGTPDWHSGQMGEAHFIDAVNDTIARSFRVPYYRRYFPLVAATRLTKTEKGPPHTAGGGNGDVLARLPFSSREQVARWVAQGVDVWEVRDGYALAHLTPAQAANLRAAGLVFTEQSLLPAGYADYPSCYRTYSDTVTFLHTLSDTHPSLVTLYDAGDSWEKTQGRADHDIWAVRLTNAAIAGPKPKLFVVAEHHARELITPEVAMRLASLLTGGFGTDPLATWLLNEREVWVMPMANPDGHVQAENHQDWRKNTDSSSSTCPGHSSPNSYGVDLNRNYGYTWGGVGSSTDPCNEVYRGTSAFSEPETQAISNTVTSQRPDVLISLHSYSDLILYPWNSTTTPPPDEEGLRALAGRMARYNGYTYGQPASLLYPVTGDTTDWAYGTLDIPSYTFEIGSWGDGFWPPCSHIDTLWNEVRNSLLYAASVADAPYERAHGPDVTGIQTGTATISGSLAVAHVLSVTARVNDPDSGGAQVAAAEVSLDRPAAAGTGQPLLAADGHFDSATEMVSGTLLLHNEVSGLHLVFVRGRDQGGHWGPPTAAWAWVENRPYRTYVPIVWNSGGR